LYKKSAEDEHVCTHFKPVKIAHFLKKGFPEVMIFIKNRNGNGRKGRVNFHSDLLCLLLSVAESIKFPS